MGYTQKELELIAIWTDVLEGFEQSWVLFQFGTCILVQKNVKDLKEYAVDLLTKWGVPIAGTPSFKFGISFLTSQGIPGCLVTCHHPDIMTYVAPAEAPVKSGDEFDGFRLSIDNFGRKKRQWDCETLKIIHIENKNS